MMVDVCRACRRNAQNTVCCSPQRTINKSGTYGINIYSSNKKNNIRKLLLYLHYRSVCAGVVHKICIQDMTCMRVYAGMCDPLLGINGLNNISLIT